MGVALQLPLEFVACASDLDAAEIDVGQVFAAKPGVVAPFQGIVKIVGIDDPKVALMRVDQLDVVESKAPQILGLKVLQKALLQGRIVPATFAPNTVPSEEQLPKHKRDQFRKIRKLMGPVLFDADRPPLDLLIFNSGFRARVFSEHAKESCVKVRKIFRYFYRYLGYGMCPEALAGEQPRGDATPPLQKIGDGRRGRTCEDGDGFGAKVTAADARPMIDKYCAPYVEGNATLIDCYVEMIRQEYLRPDEKKKLDPNTYYHFETIKKLTIGPDLVPSWHQFRSRAERLKRDSEEVKKDACDPRPPEDEPIRRGRARDGLVGPGSRYEIDATKWQLKLVSRLNRADCIGVATVYFVVDTWSGAIVGYGFSIHSPSWPLGSMALRVCISDKRQIFERLNIPYDDNVFPKTDRQIGRVIAADHEAFHIPKAKPLQDFLTVAIMGVRKAKDKGTVEGTISILKHRGPKLTFEQPGWYPKFPKRFEPDGTKEMCFTIPEAEIRLLKEIKELNNLPVPVKNIPPDAREHGLTEISRREFFDWGAERRRGQLRKVTPEEEIKHFYSRGRAEITNSGLSFEGQIFDCPRLAQHAFQRYLRSRSKYVEIRYDELLADFIFFWDPQTFQFVKADNIDDDVVRKHASFYELRKERRALNKMHGNRAISARFNAHNEADPLNSEAKEKKRNAKKTRKGVPKSQLRGKIRENRIREQPLEGAAMARVANQQHGTQHWDRDAATASAKEHTDKKGTSTKGTPRKRPNSFSRAVQREFGRIANG